MIDRKPKRKHAIDSRHRCEAEALVLSALIGLGGDVPMQQFGSILLGDYMTAVSASVDPSAYADSETFRDAYFAAEVMSKFPHWELGIDRKQAAISKFLESERLCAEANLRLKKCYVQGRSISSYTPESVLHSAREKIARLLGPFNWDHAEPHFAFGPGATFGLKSKFGDAYYKYRAKPEATRECAVLAYTCISRVPTWFDHAVALTGKSVREHMSLDLPSRVKELIDIVPGNRITTVPKNAKTERIIAIEPSMNGYVQHGIGRLIRLRLKRVGVDLDDQRLNQTLARQGSIDGSLATIDLSAASDSVSLEIVERLLPPDWVDAIKLSRSPEGVLPDGRRNVYQKVSSMGCGFTFELESLIFWALQASVRMLHFHDSIDRRFAVYGDDIIVPTREVVLLREVLEYAGFQFNSKKSFWEGPFRESCGKHYFLGDDVTPIYVRESVDTPERVIWFANQIRRYAARGFSYGLDGRLAATYDLAVAKLPKPLRKPTIPDGYGDAALFGDFDEVSPSKAPHGHEGYVGTVHVRVSTSRQFGDTPYLLRQLERVSRPRISLTEYLAKRVHDPRWRDKKLVVVQDEGVVTPSSKTKWRSVKIACALWASQGHWL